MRVKRRVSTTRICERLARASCPSTKPTRTRNECLRTDVVRGITKHASGPNPLMMTHGRSYHSPFPSCSVPIFTPSLHHHISRTVCRRGCSPCVCFFTVFQLSKSFCIVRSKVHRSARRRPSFSTSIATSAVPPSTTSRPASKALARLRQYGRSASPPPPCPPPPTE